MENIIEIYSSIKKEQKPIIQFFDLKKRNDISNNFERYAVSLLTYFSLALFTFFEAKNELYIFILLICTLSSLYFISWRNLLNTFKSSKIYYEESSWFDTKMWEKPIFLLRNDKIFANQKIRKKVNLLWKMFFFSIIQIFLLLALFYFGS